MRWRHSVGLVAGLLTLLAVLSAPEGARANGLVQREIEGRVASVDAGTGALVVVREFRGRTTRTTLRARPGVRIFSCGEEGAGLGRVKRGMVVSVFYEVVGSDGVANLIVIEAAR